MSPFPPFPTVISQCESWKSDFRILREVTQEIGTARGSGNLVRKKVPAGREARKMGEAEKPKAKGDLHEELPLTSESIFLE